MARKNSLDKAAASSRNDDLKRIKGISSIFEKRLNGASILTFAHLTTKSPADIAAAVGLSSERIIKQDWIGQARKLAEGSSANKAERDAEAPAEPAAAIEQAPISTHPVESQQEHKLPAEAVISEAQENIEALVEPAAAIEDAQAITLSGEPEKDVEPSMEQYHPATYTVKLQLDEDNNVHSTHILHAESKREGTWTGWQKTLLVDFLSDSAGLNIQSDEPALLTAEEPDRAPEVAEEHL